MAARTQRRASGGRPRARGRGREGRWRLAGLVLLATLAGCGTAEVAEPAAAPHVAAPAPEAAFTRAPSGAREVEPDWLAAHRDEVHVLDVRERDELVADGRIAGSEWIPLGTLEAVVADWDRDRELVIVCRSGRRSGRAATRLEALGFRNVASLTGGMLRWVERGHTITTEPPLAASAAQAVTTRMPDLDLEVQWTRVPSLLLGGTEACIDGRHAHAVIGTPGGDAGEFLLMLAAYEELVDRRVGAAEIDRLLDDHVASFGRFYLHTDTEALERLGAALGADPRFSGRPLATAAEVEALVRRPPPGLEDAVSDAFARPEHVGCGHLRATLEHPEEYRVRAELTAEVLRAIHRRLVRQPETIDFEVLRGRHEERSILVVRLDRPVRAYSSVPAIAPTGAARASFLVHPQVTAFVREQNAYFLHEESPWLRERGVDVEELVARIDAVGAAQLDATLAHLAPGLPRRELVFHGRDASIP